MLDTSILSVAQPPSDPESIQLSENSYRQQVFLKQAQVARWILCSIAGACLLTYLRAPIWSLLVQAFAFLVAAGVNEWCLQQVQRGYQLHLARCNLGNGLGLSIIALAFTTERLVLAAATVVIFLVLSSAYFESPIGTTAWSILGIVAFLGSLLFRHVVAIPALQLGVLEPILFYGMPGLIMILAGQYSQQINHYLRNALAESEEQRQALSVAYATVEQQVQERTAELEVANQQLRAYAAQAADLAAAQERNRIASEIHDSLGHYLTAINLQLMGAKAVLDIDLESARESLVDAQQMTKEALREAGQSVEALRQSPSSTRPLTDLVETLVARNSAAGIATTLWIRGELRSFSAQVNEALYRTIQESLTNIRKHAQATQVAVQLDYTSPVVVRVTIEDNGVGTDDVSGGFGVLGIRERIDQLGGTLHIRTAAGAGFRLEVEVRT